MPTAAGIDLELNLLDPAHCGLLRLFYRPNMDWEAPPPEHRNLRVDPPSGHKSDFAVLYTSDDLATVAMECRILQARAVDDSLIWAKDLAQKYKIVRYAFSKPALFIPIDGRNRHTLGLSTRKPGTLGTYDQFQEVGLDMFQRFGEIAHGLSWQSFHRNQPGRVYAVWHHRKAHLGLAITSPDPYTSLFDDSQWKSFVKANPGIQMVNTI